MTSHRHRGVWINLASCGLAYPQGPDAAAITAEICLES